MKWLVFLMVLPLASASILPANCSTAPVDHAECQNIVSDTSLTLTEKEDLYLNLLNSQTSLPNHDFLWNWNNQIVFNQAPENVSIQSNGVLQNAWLKIIGINKSVYDTNQNQWLAQPQGQIQIVKNYSLVTPSGTLPGECQTTYSTDITQNQLQIQANGHPIGNNSPASYNLALANNADLNFKAVWDIVARKTTNHYQNRQHCFFDGRDWHCWTTCDFVNTTQDYYSLHLVDELNTIVKAPQYSVSTAFDAPNQKLWLKINSNEPLNEVSLTNGNKSFAKSQARYDLNQRLAPYGVLYATRTPENIIKTDFLLTNQYENQIAMVTDSIENCQLEILTDFEQTTRPCNVANLTPTRIELSTDKNQFDTNETILLQARLLNDQNQPLADKDLVFSTKNSIQTKTTNADGIALWSLPANQSNGVLSAQFKSDDTFAESQNNTRLPITDSKTIPRAIDVTSIFTAYYFLLAIVKRKAGWF